MTTVSSCSRNLHIQEVSRLSKIPHDLQGAASRTLMCDSFMAISPVSSLQLNTQKDQLLMSRDKQHANTLRHSDKYLTVPRNKTPRLWPAVNSSQPVGIPQTDTYISYLFAMHFHQMCCHKIPHSLIVSLPSFIHIPGLIFSKSTGSFYKLHTCASNQTLLYILQGALLNFKGLPITQAHSLQTHFSCNDQ